MVNIASPYLLLIGDARSHIIAKTAIGIAYWRSDLVAGQFRFDREAFDLGLPDLSIDAAAARGVRTLVVGVAPLGGELPEPWIDTIVAALRAGLDVANGLHTRLREIPRIRAAAEATGRQVFDVRHPTERIPLGTGQRRSGKRLLTVGTDCAVGKMYTSLAIDRALRERGLRSDFRATGQTGILIAGSGIAVDAVVSDFVAGATEQLSPANDPDHWDLIEGQGSLFHPAYAGVSLGLLHGSQADAIVLCHEAGRTHINGIKGYPLPDLQTCIDTNLQLGRLTNPNIRCVGIGINTSKLQSDAALRLLQETSARMGLPCVDPVRTGVWPIVDYLLRREAA
jgi:uncharacterized NAD-dependent epimerase/dehydratase family protein